MSLNTSQLFTQYLGNGVSVVGATLQSVGLIIPVAVPMRTEIFGTVYFEINGLGTGIDIQFVQSAGGLNNYNQKLLLYQTAVGLQSQNIDGLPSLFSNPGITGTGYALDFSAIFFPNAACSLDLQFAENVATASISILEGSVINFQFVQ